MAELKDFIPKGNEDENSADSWFVLSSASDEDDEDEDDEPEIKTPNVAQLENALGKKDNELTAGKPDTQQSDNFQEEMLTNEKKENGPVDEAKIEKPKDIQIDTAEKKENDSMDKEPKIEQGKTPQEKIIGEILNNEKPETPMELEGKTVQENECVKPEIEEKKEEKLKGNETKMPEVEVEKVQKSNNFEHKTPTTEESLQHRKETMMAEAEKAAIVKQRRKPKTLRTDEEGHSEIALEVHALRETLIQLSLNLSSTEEEKYTAITSEVQALREALTQFNNDLSNRVSQIEARSEQVHTLLCRFIMTRCGNYKEPPSKRNHAAGTSDAAVQTETPNSVLSEATVSHDEVLYRNESKETSVAASTPFSVGAVLENLLVEDSAKTSHSENEPKSSPFKSDIPSKEQSESHGLKRLRQDDDTSQVSRESSHISETSGESVYTSPPNKFLKGRRRNRRPRSKHPGTSEHNFRESFNQYPHQTQSYKADQELADLAYRYSSENANYWRKNRANHPWPPGNNRKHPYSKQMQEGQDEHSNRFPDELDDFMDKVIDEWAQDEDD